ncbi:MAG: TRAP transporter small permease subunit [Hoeflea sp.]|uniref:TRAP transporter small permease n=1 Tax=Hoeflea sp. TaxID=1940281 RepID=UPI00329755CA
MRILESIPAVIMAALLFFGFVNIVMRLVFGGGLIWFSDVGRYALVWMVLIGAAAVSIRNAHIAVDVGLNERVSPLLVKIFATIRFLAIGAFLAVLLVESVKLTLSTLPQTFITVRWLSLGWAYAALPVGALLMLLALVLGTFRTRPAASENGNPK